MRGAAGKTRVPVGGSRDCSDGDGTTGTLTSGCSGSDPVSEGALLRTLPASAATLDSATKLAPADPHGTVPLGDLCEGTAPVHNCIL